MSEAREFLVRYTAALTGPPRLTVVGGEVGPLRLSMEPPNDEFLTFFLTRISTAPAHAGVQFFSRILRLTRGVKTTRDFSGAKPLPDFLQPLLMENVAQKALDANLPPDEILQVYCFKPRQEQWRHLAGVAHEPPVLFVCRTASESFRGHGINSTFEGRIRFLDPFSAEAGWDAHNFPDLDYEFVTTIFTLKEPVDEDGNPIGSGFEQTNMELAAPEPFTCREFRIFLGMIIWVLAHLPQGIYFTIKHGFQRRAERRKLARSKARDS